MTFAGDDKLNAKPQTITKITNMIKTKITFYPNHSYFVNSNAPPKVKMNESRKKLPED